MTAVSTQVKPSRLEGLSESATRGLAKRLSRRSLVGRFGRGVVAFSIGAAGMDLLRPSSATAALGCPCSGGCPCTVSCEYLPIWFNNECPAQTCRCGNWCFNDNTCASGIRRWVDCCDLGWCANHGGCYCVAAKNRPTCCLTHVYHNGDCNPSGGITVCRMHSCVSSCSTPPVNNYC